MKKLTVLVLTLIYVLGLVGCSQPQVEKPGGQHYFNGAVLEIHEDYLLAECLEETDGVVRVGEQAEVSTDVISANGVPELAVGDHIRVVFDATNDSIPIQVGNVFAIYLLDENGKIIDP